MPSDVSVNFGKIGKQKIPVEHYGMLVSILHEFGGIERFEGEQLYQYYIQLKDAKPEQLHMAISRVKKDIRENVSSQTTGRDVNLDVEGACLVILCAAENDEDKAYELFELGLRKVKAMNVLIEANV